VVQAYANSGSGTGVNADFPDGQLDCSTFPSEYGAVSVDWLNLGGWASVQKPNEQTAAGYNDILSVTKAQCSGSSCCVEGAFCSYACPDGTLKVQWPAEQGATGQSVGGLYCNNGKLHLTNPAYKTLCATGSSNINVYVQNKLSQNVAICRTNYPGTCCNNVEKLG
jgi:SUN family beta-glucosidase